MERYNVLGMICGYYLSRFDEHAYARFGHATQSATHKALADAFGIPSRSIQNWRDEFDPVHDNLRQGWHKREMYASRKRVIEAFSDLTESEVFVVVSSITRSPSGQVVTEIVATIGDADANIDETALSTGLRGLTGIKAETTFVDYHTQTGLPIRGLLLDCRHEQCGYDFKVETGSTFIAVEVKGLAGQQGGISFMDKEWQVAQAMGDRYYLVIVRSVGSNPQVSIIPNPAALLEAKIRLYTTVQVSWSVGQSVLCSVETEQRGQHEK